MDRSAIEIALADLERQLPKFLAAIDPEFQVLAFAEHADAILDAAAPEDRGYAFKALEAIALRHGVVLPAKGTA